MRTHRQWTFVVLLGLMIASGCVKRQMVITSEPTGAEVVVNQTWRGETPFVLPYKHAGVYDIRLEKPGYYPLMVREPVIGKWHDRMGPDLVADVAPVNINDIRKFHYKLEPIAEADPIEDILTRRDQMKERINRIAAKREAQEKDRFVTPLPLPERDPKDDDDKDGTDEAKTNTPNLEPESPSANADESIRSPSEPTANTSGPELDLND